MIERIYSLCNILTLLVIRPRCTLKLTGCCENLSDAWWSITPAITPRVTVMMMYVMMVFWKRRISIRERGSEHSRSISGRCAPLWPSLGICSTFKQCREALEDWCEQIITLSPRPIARARMSNRSSSEMYACTRIPLYVFNIWLVWIGGGVTPRVVLV